MAEGRQKDQWQHTSWILSTLANSSRDPTKRSSPFKPSDFNPFEAAKPKPKEQKLMVGIEALKVFL